MAKKRGRNSYVLKGQSEGGMITIRLPKELHFRLVQESDRAATSLNTYCVEALSEKLRRVGSRRARGSEGQGV